MPPSEPLLEVRGLTVAYGELVAVDQLDLTLVEGETVAVLGPSGCGKSSVLRAIAGLVPVAGMIRLAGEDVTAVPTHRRRVGLMFQEHALFPHRDVAGNVGFGPRMLGWPRGRVAERTTEVLELVGLAGYERRHVDELSGGQRQRVALARALAPEPRLVMLDEPLGSIDRVLRDRLLGDLPDVFARAGATVLVVTHDHDEARVLGDRIAVMRDGRIEQIGPPDELRSAPASPFVAEFLGIGPV